METLSTNDTVTQKTNKKNMMSNVLQVLLFYYYLSMEKVVALLLNKLDSPYPWVFCLKFGLNWLNTIEI